MRRSEEELTLYSMLAYLGASLLATVLLLLAALAAMKAFFAAARFALGPPEVYWLKPALYDSLGFALASAGTALTQYFLVSLLCRRISDKPFLAALVAFCALFCGLLFWRGTIYSALGGYGFSGLSITLSALLGGLEAVLQKPSDNPWQFSPAKNK